ncbi:MAG: protein kinase, partial [Sedimentisphaerales bacterium]
MCSEHENEEAIFYAALGIRSPSERAAYLEKACGVDKKLLTRMEALLKVQAAECSFLEAVGPHLRIALDEEPLSEAPGTVISRYLKIIKLGMDTRSVIARFEAERQALAMMDHPNIAKVLDAGATETGRPYFVMELVKGASITDFCDATSLSTTERLELFVCVCRAVQHAHQKGIIHRDIKPSNIMVTLHDSRPVPKVIDFGIAKATKQKLTEKTLFTRYAQMIGTPTYMSPEQAQFGDSEIDLRTDIYSLGILLYELLTGTTPFAEEQLRKAGYLEMQRIICEEAPVKPSTKLSTLAMTLPEIAERRSAEPDALKKRIRGDLDWIVMKALEKDRDRRYKSSHDLAADIERHLEDKPVSAGPPSAGYRLHKFIRRNRVAMITLTLVAAALAIGATTATIAIWNSGGLPGKAYHAAGMAQRHVWDIPPNSSFLGGISRDGRYLSYVDWTLGNVAVYDLTAEKSWQVTKNTDPTWETSDGSNESSAISNDGRQIAYSWLNHTEPLFYDLRIIDVDGANMRVLRHDPNAIFLVMPYDFSPDGHEILAYFSDANANLVDEKTGKRFRKGHLVLVSVADGSVQTLKTWQRRGIPRRARFSPDDRYVAYDFEQKDDPTRHDIFLMDLTSGSEIGLIEHRANDRLCGWTPGGRRVVFISDRSSKRDVYLARLDSTGLNFEGDPTLVSSQYVGSTVMADWSPDGRSLAYRIGNSFIFGTPLAICSVGTSEERLVSPAELFRPNSRILGPRFSPDGQSLLVTATGQKSGYGLYTVNVETGLPELIYSIGDGRMRRAVWSPDGASIYIRSPFKLSRLDLASGRETELCPDAGGVRGMDVSPDGRRLAFYQGSDLLVVMPSVGGEPHEVAHLEEDETNRTQQSFLRWTPDSQYLLFCKRESQMWRVNVESGIQQQIGPTMK